MPLNSETDIALRRHCEERLLGLRNNRYSWWVHARDLADYYLPRRYKWLITPNQQFRGSPLNQHILDSTGTLAARNLASGMMSGISSPTRPWFKLKIGHIDSTQTSPVSLWLGECERLMGLVLGQSNFYNSVAVLYFDLVVFGTAVMLIYEDFDNVICCYNRAMASTTSTRTGIAADSVLPRVHPDDRPGGELLLAGERHRQHRPPVRRGQGQSDERSLWLTPSSRTMTIGRSASQRSSSSASAIGSGVAAPHRRAERKVQDSCGSEGSSSSHKSPSGGTSCRTTPTAARQRWTPCQT